LNKTTELLNETLPLGGKIDLDKLASRPTDLDMLGINYRGSPSVLDENTANDGSVYNAYGSTEGKLLLRAGDRAPDAPGLVEVHKQATIALFDIFSPTHHTILVFGLDAINRARAVIDVVKKFPEDVFRIVVCLAKHSESDVPKDWLGQAQTVVVTDAESHAYGAYLLADQESGIFVVRPDGVLGAIVDSTEGLQRYINLVFV
jgi:hypothetical protein